MYIAASVSLWLLRAWKIGDNDRKECERVQDQRASEKGDAESLEEKTMNTNVVDEWRSDAVSKWWRYGFV
jgi:hypothetical protein